jgi:hypothetical protein
VEDVSSIDGAPAWSAALFLATLPLAFFVGGRRRQLGERRFEALGALTAAVVVSAALPYSLVLTSLVVVTFLAFSLATWWLLTAKSRR